LFGIASLIQGAGFLSCGAAIQTGMRRLLPIWIVVCCVGGVGCVPLEGEVGALRLAAEPELDEVELEFLRLLNEYRDSIGAPPLAPVYEINAAADAHSEDMGLRGYFAHEALEPAPFGVLPWERMCHFGYGPACSMTTEMGENIAAGYPDAFSAFEAWRHSPGHDANMRDGRFRAIGIGRVRVEGTLYLWYWTTDFAGDTPDCICADGQQRTCETDSCGPGRSTCQDCEFGPCEVPGSGDRDICNDGFDNDCDGTIDEEEDCGPRCEAQPEVCDGEDNDCDGEVDEDQICDVICFPLDEVCDGVDNDCDFTVDEGCPCDHRPDNPLCGSDVGQCSRGTQECEWTPEERRLTVCGGAIAPTVEICDGFDNDCDGLIDEGDLCATADSCECRAAGPGGPIPAASVLLLVVIVASRRGLRR
jgi:uncharacterized protein YkwD